MGGGSVLVVNIDLATGCLDKTWREIREAQASGQVVMIIADEYGENLRSEFVTSTRVLSEEPETDVYVVGTTAIADYTTSSEDGYPCEGLS